MDKASGKLIVFFEDPFWVGVFERIVDGKISVCKVTFGAEPKDYEVKEFVLQNYSRLRFSPSMTVEVKAVAGNPKRKRRDARKQIAKHGVGTKSQQALQKQREEMKTERKQISKEQKELEKKRQYALKQKKRKKKHRGH